MSETSSKDSRPRLKLLSEALKERLSPGEWSRSRIFGEDWKPPSLN